MKFRLRSLFAVVTCFGPHKLAMSRLGGAVEIRTHVLDGVTLNKTRALVSNIYSHKMVKR